MAYLTELQLEQYAVSPEMTKTAGAFIKESKSAAELTVFLSHSHADEKRVRGLINLLAKLGIKLYVDWLDHTMPKHTTRETASKIKAQIKSNDVFMLLATTSALASRWVPWEVGVADSIKPLDTIVVVPVADKSGRFEGNEYLQLYKRLVIATDGHPAIFNPGDTQNGSRFDAFARNTRKIIYG